MSSPHALFFLTALAASAGSGCEPSPATSASSTPGAGTTVTSGALERTVVEQLSAARSDQEEACHHVGGDTTRASRSLCMEKVRSGVSRDVQSYRCPRGMAEDVPGACIEDVKSEPCDHPFRSLNQYRSCRDDALCNR
jgi:hypothetical protein